MLLENITFRSARHDELKMLSSIGSKAFADDAIYGHLYPHCSGDQDALQQVILGNLAKLWNTSGAKIVVGELDRGQVIGFVTFKYHGPSERKDFFDASNPIQGEMNPLQLRVYDMR